jgi:four helix bundle protein
MGGVERFEDLIAWQKARVLTKAVYLATQKDRFARDFGLTGQIQRASVSIMSNLAEGFERGNPGDFDRFVVIAKGSCAEVRAQLCIALDIGYLEESEYTHLNEQAEEVSRLLGGLRVSLEKRLKH